MALEGTLQDMSLTDLFAIFRIGVKTGVLLLKQHPERAVVYVANGSLVDAVVFNELHRRLIANGELAIIHLLAWENATFTFFSDKSALLCQRRIFRDNDTLIREALDNSSSSRRAALERSLTLDTRLAMTLLPERADQAINLDLEQWRILSQISICDTIQEICTNTRKPAEEVIPVVAGLIKFGLIEVKDEARNLPFYDNVSPYKNNQSAPEAAGKLLVRANSNRIRQPGKRLLQAIMRRVHNL